MLLFNDENFIYAFLLMISIQYELLMNFTYWSMKNFKKWSIYRLLSVLVWKEAITFDQTDFGKTVSYDGISALNTNDSFLSI